MEFKVLFVEDNMHKRERVLEFLNDNFDFLTVFESHSFASGCQSIDNDVYDLIILDMSLPTYDKNGTEMGGRFRPFGGREIARKIKRRGIHTKIIFITQYESFSHNGSTSSLKMLSDELASEFPDQCLSVIYYDSSMSAWKSTLLEIMKSISGIE